jgi:hypothetical protein
MLDPMGQALETRVLTTMLSNNHASGLKVWNPESWLTDGSASYTTASG